ncbi:MAG: DUF3800 domain-containing protein [Bacilli bacterium]|nr:DUF3800 domain-containing protein [Bacilli bacterium]
MKELSIFIDESGNFGTYDYHSPLYIFSLVFHDQNNDISGLVELLNHQLDLIDYGSRYFHAGPIIRRENEYKELDIKTRRKIFNKMSFFADHVDYNYATVAVEKKHIEDEVKLSVELSKQLGRVIRDNLSFFQQFDTIKVYYDNGQKQLSRLLIVVLTALLDKPIFKLVKPRDYNLFQVADLISTLELTNIKYKNKTISQSEIYFFGEYRYFYRNYYRNILKKRL